MPDKWAQYAVPNDKWAQYAQPAPAQKTLPGSPTTTMRPQTLMERLTNIEPVTSKMPLSESIPAFVGDIGAAGINTLAHPLDTLKGVASSVMNPAATLKGIYDGLNTRPAETIAQGIGQAGALAPVAELAPKVAAPILAKAGGAAQDAGTGLMNKTIGTLKPDFRRGANPARGYLEAGGGPALSMQGLANQAANLKTDVGQAIPSVLGKSKTVIPTNEVTSVLNKPIAKAVSLELGPGGTGNVDPIQRYAAGFNPALKIAQESGGMTPLQLWEMKRSIAANTNWSDPSQFNLKAVRQQQAGGLGGLLSDKVPDVAPLNQQYGDLTKFATRAQSRADTHSLPLTSLMFKTGSTALGAGAGMMDGHPILGAALGAAADSVPVKSTLASGLYHGGRGLSSLGDGVVSVPSLNPAAVAIPAYDLTAKKQDKRK